METKTKKNKSESNNDWKSLIHGFVGDVLARVSDNVSHRIHDWMKNFKRRAIGSVLMLLGATYFLTGLSDYANSLFVNFPGFGAGLVGAVVIFIGYLISRD